MSVETNKAIVSCFFEEVFNHRNIDLVDKLVAPNFINHNASFQTRGIERVYKGVAAQLEVFPDIQNTIEDTIAEKDKVVVRCTDHLPGRRMVKPWRLLGSRF